MALRFMDGFDHYQPNSDNDLLAKWSSRSNTVSAPVSGRLGGQAMQLTDRNVTKIIDAQGTWIVGFAVRFVTSVATSSNSFFELQDGGTCQVGLLVNSGKISIHRNGSIIATGTKTLSPNVWYFVEFKATINSSGGTAECRLDGVVEVSYSGDTNSTANNTADRIYLQDTTNQPGTYFDDLYVLDGTGSSPYQDYLGDCRIETIFPNGNGNSSQFTGSDGNSTDNYLLVDDTTDADDDSTYVETSTVNNKDTYTYGDLASTSGTVYAVAVNPWWRKTDAGTRQACTVARTSGTEVDSGNVTLATGYTLYQNIRTTKPGGGSWTISDVNASEFGIKVTV